ncbi:MAG TPA: bifunctional YncE family protein/alkaline phosphatase family protein [Tepidisphaeraceae bacterium]|jgi:YVTN family beta-propeller protein
MKFRKLAALGGVALSLVLGWTARAEEARTRGPGEDVKAPELRERSGLLPGDNLLFNGWGVTPAGQHVGIRSDLALKMIVAPDGKRLIAVTGGYNDHGLSVIDLATRKLTQHLPMTEAWNGLAFSTDGQRIFVTTGDEGAVQTFTYAEGEAKADKKIHPDPKGYTVFLAGLAVHPKTGKVYVCNLGNNEVWVLNEQTLALETKIAVGERPHSCAFGADPRYLYVSNWGGRSVSVIDTKDNQRVRDIPVGLRPNDMALAPDGRLFVACSGDNTVQVITTKTLEAAPQTADSTKRLWEGSREIISTSLYPESPEGSTPDAVAVSPDGKTLYVANADNNDVLVADISGQLLDENVRKFGQSVSIVNGFIPTGWYPSALAVSPDGKTLFVANGKGLRSHSNVKPADLQNGNRPSRPAVHIAKTLEGSISFIDRPDAGQMSKYNEQVRKNSPYTPESFRKASVASDSVVPDRVGADCPIKYVLYVIKENRTYDQVMGDMTDAAGKHIGNGDPRLTMYGESITPNQHQLARDYVLMDNLYCNGEVSVDGHSWCDAAIATDWNVRSWLLSYSKHGKLPGNEELETPAAGYLWDLCRRHGVSYRNYGEGTQQVPSANRGLWAPAWKERDMDRVTHWVDDLKQCEQTGQEPPRFTIMSLGENHTQGTTPGAHTPSACVGSNDLGVGRIVEAATHSKYWNQMAIFIIEDDAQNGPDHVDAHRTVGLVLSPYCKRGAVDSTLYTTASMVRTMELILGLPPMTQYDAGATPMFNCFGKEAASTPFTAIRPKTDLFAVNTRKSPGAKESAAMDFSDYDLAPEDALNRILWAAAKDPDAAYPTPIHRAVFTARPSVSR